MAMMLPGYDDWILASPYENRDDPEDEGDAADREYDRIRDDLHDTR